MFSECTVILNCSSTESEPASELLLTLVHVHTYVYTLMLVYTSLYIQAYKCVCVCVCVCVHNVCVCGYTCLYVQIWYVSILVRRVVHLNDTYHSGAVVCATYMYMSVLPKPVWFSTNRTCD